MLRQKVCHNLAKLGVSDQLVTETARGAVEGARNVGGLAAIGAGIGTYALMEPGVIDRVGAATRKSLEKVRLPTAALAAAVAFYLGAKKVGLPFGALRGAASHEGFRRPPPRRHDPLDTDRVLERERALLNVLSGKK